MTGLQIARELRAKGWTVEYDPQPDLPRYLWREPDGDTHDTYRSHHPDAPPAEAVCAGHYNGHDWQPAGSRGVVCSRCTVQVNAVLH